MDYKNLGKSGLKVSRIRLGTNNFGGQVCEEASIAIVNRALDCGINVIDTARTPRQNQTNKPDNKKERNWKNRPTASRSR